jgi:DNA-binding MarR family transcriptional regulator
MRDSQRLHTACREVQVLDRAQILPQQSQPFVAPGFRRHLALQSARGGVDSFEWCIYTYIMTNHSELRPCADCLCLASRRAARTITRAFDRHLRPHGVRATQFTLLTMLELKGPTPLTELAEVLGMERTTLTRNLALLEAERWVDIRPDPADARSRIIATAPKGRAIITAALPAWRKAQAQAVAAVGSAGVAALKQLAHNSA